MQACQKSWQRSQPLLLDIARARLHPRSLLVSQRPRNRAGKLLFLCCLMIGLQVATVPEEPAPAAAAASRKRKAAPKKPASKLAAKKPRRVAFVLCKSAQRSAAVQRGSELCV